MSTIERIAADQSLNGLFMDYLTCTLTLDRARKGETQISKQVEASLSKRLRDLTILMLKAVRKQNHLQQPTTDTVHKAALHIMQQHPSGPDFYLSRLSVR